MDNLTISTEYNGEHKDFSRFEHEALGTYLKSFKYDEGISLSLAVRQAILQHKPYIVEPVNVTEDLTINLSYK